MDNVNLINWVTKGENRLRPQEVCFNIAQKLKHTAFLARDNIQWGCGAKQYTSFNTHDDLIEYINYTQDKHHYEIITNECVEYYDFDYDKDFLLKFKEKYDKDPCSITSFIYDLIEIRNNFFNYLFTQQLITVNSIITFEDVLILDSSRPDKISIHAIIRPLENCHYFPDISIQKKIMLKFKEFIQASSSFIKLDTSVYSSNSLFRCLGQTKPNQKSFLKRFGDRSKFVVDEKEFLCSYTASAKIEITLQEDTEKLKPKYTEIDHQNCQSTNDILNIWKLIKNSVQNKTNKYLCDKSDDGKFTDKIEYDIWKNLASALFKYLSDDLCISIFPELYSLYRNYNPSNEQNQLRTLLQTKGRYGYTIKSLHMWANCDDSYNKEFPQIVDQKIKKFISGTHFDLAKLFFIVYGKKNIKITSQQDLSYFQWDEQILLWVENKKESLIKLVSDIILPIIYERLNILKLELEMESENIQPIKIKLHVNKSNLLHQILSIDPELSDSIITLNKMQTKELKEYLITLHNEYLQNYYESNISAKILRPQHIIIEEQEILQKIITNLKSFTFLNNVCKTIASYKINDDFESKIINKQPYELPIKNGFLINLKTLEVRKRHKNDYWSFECPVSFDLNYNLNCVNKFFDDICCNDLELKNYHQLLWGYLLTGEIKDRSLHIFYGNGCNGKSSIINIIRNILLNFYVSLSEDLTIKKSSRGASPELMDLLYSRCGSLPESDKKEELNSKRIKTITGDDEINARHLFGHSIKFKTQCKLLWATNHKPKINVDDQAIIDRIKLIPFYARFEKNQINTDYITDLQENKLNEFFTWFCIGAKNWYNRQELIPCKVMIDAMNQYISDNDVIQEFIDDVLDLITKEDYENMNKLEKINNRMKKTTVYALFIDWIKQQRKEEQINKKDFYEVLSKRCSSVKISTDFYLCKMKNDEDAENEELDGLVLK